MKKIRFVFPFIVSLILHCVSGGLFLYSSNPRDEKQNEGKNSQFLIEVEISGEQTKVQNSSRHRAASSSSQKKVTLFPTLANKVDLLSQVSRNSEFGTDSSIYRGIYDEKIFDGNIDDVFGKNNNQNWEFYRAIYQSIDTHLVFNSILAQMKHFGRVRAQFKVSKNGLIDLNSIQVIASDPILKVHTLRAIAKALSIPLKDNKHLQTGESELILTEFNYKFENPQSNYVKQKAFGSNKFIFNRATLEKPIPDELLEHLINGGITPNISLMLERWQKYNKKKEWTKFQFDPLIRYKNDPFYNL